MSKKRVLVGVSLILISVLLVFPKPNLGFLNWSNSVLMIIFTFIPILLIAYGIILLKKNKPNIGGEEGEEDSVSIKNDDEFKAAKNWEAKNNWKGGGTDIWRGAIKNDEFTMETDKKTSHFAKKIKFLDLKSLTIDLEISKKGNIETFVELGTSNNKEDLGKLDTEKLKKSQKIDLKDGKNEIKPDLDWEDYLFFKIVLHREDTNIKAPKIKNVSFEGKLTKDDVRRDNSKKVGEEEEEMPAFEDVEYKDLECPECGEHFKTDIGLRVHRKVNHPEEFKKNPDPYGDE